MKPASKTNGHPAAGGLTENQQSHRDVMEAGKRGEDLGCFSGKSEVLIAPCRNTIHQHVMTTSRPLRHLQEPSVDAYNTQ